MEDNMEGELKKRSGEIQKKMVVENGSFQADSTRVCAEGPQISSKVSPFVNILQRS